MEELTGRQKEVLKIIKEETTRGRAFPTFREIAGTLGINISAVQGHIHALQKKGWIQKQDNFTLTKDAFLDPSTFPLVATIPAGVPLEAFDQTDCNIQFSHDYFGKGKILAVNISGDSMAGDSICDGDVAIIQLQNHIDKNDIAVVRVDHSEVTLKRIRKKKNIIELIPSNPRHKVKEVPAENVEILGKLVGVVRRT